LTPISRLTRRITPLLLNKCRILFPILSLNVVCLFSMTTASGCAFKMGDGTPVPAASELISAGVSRANQTQPEKGSLLIPCDLDKLIRESQLVITGKVLKVLPSRGVEQEEPGTDYYIYTDIVIKPDRFLFGSSSQDSIIVSVQGGKIGNLVMWAQDQPVFVPEEDVMVFLYRPDGYTLDSPPAGIKTTSCYLVTGAIQGKFQLRENIAFSISGYEYPVSRIEERIDALKR